MFVSHINFCNILTSKTIIFPFVCLDEYCSENLNPFANTLIFFLKIVDLFAELNSILLLINEHPLGVVHSLLPKKL